MARRYIMNIYKPNASQLSGAHTLKSGIDCIWEAVCIKVHPWGRWQLFGTPQLDLCDTYKSSCGVRIIADYVFVCVKMQCNSHRHEYWHQTAMRWPTRGGDWVYIKWAVYRRGRRVPQLLGPSSSSSQQQYLCHSFVNSSGPQLGRRRRPVRYYPTSHGQACCLSLHGINSSF